MCGCFGNVAVEFLGTAAADDGGDEDKGEDEASDAYDSCERGKVG